MHTRDSVGVMIDTENGDFSFVLNGVNLGVAYERIPLSYLMLFFFIEAVILWSSWFETEESVLFFHLILQRLVRACEVLC